MSESGGKGEKVYSMPLHDMREAEYKIRHPPTVHIARGFQNHLPFLNEGRPIICISDWQYETETQVHFWEQAETVLKGELGEEALAHAIVLVAGDMASSNNALLGAASDEVPNIQWLRDSVPHGDIFMLYGNHDNVDESHLSMVNPSTGLHCLLPHGKSIEVPLLGGNGFMSKDHKAPALLPTAENTSNSAPSRRSIAGGGKNESVKLPPGMTKQERMELYKKLTFEKKPKATKMERQERQWRNQNVEQARLADRMKAMHFPTSHVGGNAGQKLRIAACHGIPSSHTQGMKKIERSQYFRDLGRACSSSSSSPLDILMTHSNPRLPGQEGRVRGDDAPRIFDEFLRSEARLHLHGHMHTDPVVSVVAEGKVVVNSDCRVVALVPPGERHS